MPCSTAVNLWLYAILPLVGSGDGDAATDSFKDAVIHAVRVEVLVSGRPLGW